MRVAQPGAQLRAAPEENAGLIILLPAGDYILVTAVETDWCQAEYEGQRGYVPTNNLEFP